MSDRLSGVSVFVETVEAGGFSAAASKLHLSRSAVGKTIARLEERLGVRLFHRTTRNQGLTVCAAPAYLAAQGTPGTLDELMAHDAVAYGRQGRISPWRFPRDGGQPLEVVPKARLRLDDLEAIADAASAGFGLAWLP